jgi:hypothetical protein
MRKALFTPTANYNNGLKIITFQVKPELVEGETGLRQA